MPSETRSERVWKRLLQAYGARFTDSFGLKPSEPWIAAIEDLTNDQISFGIRACLRLEPVHPPTLGVFQKACVDIPIPQHETGPSIQEQLCEYVALNYRHVQGRGTDLFTYLYREWFDATRPKGRERCAECTGVLIPAVGQREGFRVNVIDMLADSSGHGRVLRRLSKGYQGVRNRELELT